MAGIVSLGSFYFVVGRVQAIVVTTAAKGQVSNVDVALGWCGEINTSSTVVLSASSASGSFVGCSLVPLWVAPCAGYTVHPATLLPVRLLAES
jgi:hypothetical protein